MTTADAGTTTVPGTYHLFHEAWHADACRPAPGATETGRELYVRVGPDDAACEIFFTEHRLDATPELAVRVHIWDDSWAAVRHVPALFAGLARLSADADDPRPSIEYVTALLGELGFVDVTERQRPGDDTPAARPPGRARNRRVEMQDTAPSLKHASANPTNTASES